MHKINYIIKIGDIHKYRIYVSYILTLTTNPYIDFSDTPLDLLTIHDRKKRSPSFYWTPKTKMRPHENYMLRCYN